MAKHELARKTSERAKDEAQLEAWTTRVDTLAALEVMMGEFRLQFFRVIFGAADPGRAPLISHQKK